MTTEELRQQILQLVTEYTRQRHSPRAFVPGESVIPPSGKANAIAAVVSEPGTAVQASGSAAEEAKPVEEAGPKSGATTSLEKAAAKRVVPAKTAEGRATNAPVKAPGKSAGKATAKPAVKRSALRPGAKHPDRAKGR